MKIKSKPATKKSREGWERVFGGKQKQGLKDVRKAQKELDEGKESTVVFTPEEENDNEND